MKKSPRKVFHNTCLTYFACAHNLILASSSVIVLAPWPRIIMAEKEEKKSNEISENRKAKKSIFDDIRDSSRQRYEI